MTWQFGAMVCSLSLVLSFDCGSAKAQGFDFYKLNGSPTVLRYKSEWKELKLSDEQVEKVTAIERDYSKKNTAMLVKITEETLKLPEGQREAKRVEAARAIVAAQRPLLDEANAKVGVVLSAGQMKRSKQLVLQHDLPSTFVFPDISERLDLSQEQKKIINGFIRDHHARQEDFVDARGKVADRKATIEDLKQFRKRNSKQTTESIVAILNDSQKATWKEMLGAPFDSDEY